MRIGSSLNNINTDIRSNDNSVTVKELQPKAEPMVDKLQSAPTGPNLSAAMRQAEASIGAALRSSKLGNQTDSLSFGDILKKILDIFRKPKPTPTPTPTPSSQTSLQVQGDASFRQRVATDLAKFAPGTTVDSQGYVHEAKNKVAGHDSGYALINQLLASSKPVTIGFVADNAYTQSGNGAQGSPSRPSSGSAAQVFYDPSLNISLPTLQANGTIKNEGIASEIVLAHELTHALHAQRGTIDRSQVSRTFKDGNQTYSETWRFEEFRTTGFSGFRQGAEPTENSIRAELGYKPRATYLDRSGWTAVNGVSANNNVAANTTTANLYQPDAKGNFQMCGCFSCGDAGVKAAQV